MGFFGGSAQASNNNAANISYSPVLVWGDGNNTTKRENFAPSTTSKPTLDDSTSASVGAALAPGSSATGGTVARSQTPYSQNETVATPVNFGTNDKPINNSNYMGYIMAAVGGAALIYMSKQPKKKAK